MEGITGLWDFDFGVRVSAPIVSAMPGESLTVPVTIELVRGKSRPVALSVATNWGGAGIVAQVDPPSVMPPSMATFTVVVSATTPPGSYMFGIQGSTQGTFKSSEALVTVVVGQRPPDRKDENTSQSQAGSPPPSSASLAVPQAGRGEPKVQTPYSPKKSSAFIPLSIVIISVVLGFANMQGWISLPHISLPGVDGNGGGLAYDGTYDFTETYAVWGDNLNGVGPGTPRTSSGSFTIENGKSTTAGFTGAVDANGNFSGIFVFGAGIPDLPVTGTFSTTASFTISGSSVNTWLTMQVRKR
jgi:hypothetical protein